MEPSECRRNSLSFRFCNPCCSQATRHGCKPTVRVTAPQAGAVSAAEPYYRRALRESEEMEAGHLRRPANTQDLARWVNSPPRNCSTGRLSLVSKKTPAPVDAEPGMANALTNWA